MQPSDVRAFILAAGLGTRLRPLTDTVPKALVPVLGVPMLERLRAFLAGAGIRTHALNTHHLADAVRAHVSARADPPALFHEPELLGTGGALVNAAAFWGEAPLLVWNADILCDLDAAALLRAHAGHADAGALATLAVQRRPSTSHLLVDAGGRLCGLDSERRGTRRLTCDPDGAPEPVAFNGVSVLAPGLQAWLPAGGAFDLITALLDAVAAGARVQTHDAGAAAFGSTGALEELAALEALLRERPEVLRRWGGPA